MASLRRYVPMALTVGVGVGLSVVAFIIVRGWEQERIKSEFERRARAQVNALHRSLESHIDVLQSIAGVYVASREVERSEFRDLVALVLPRYPGVQALEWVPRVRDAERGAYEAAARRDGHAEFRITERNTRGQMVKAARRPEYFPVYFVEPLTGNEIALGFDLGSHPARLEALERARETGAAIATARVKLVQEAGEQYGFLVLLPIYRMGAPKGTPQERRRNLRGFALGVFRVGDLVETALKDFPREGINVLLSDSSAPSGERLLYLSSSRAGQVSPHPLEEEGGRDQAGPHWGTMLNIAGRQWSLLFRPSAEFLAGQHTLQPWVVLGGGLLFTALLGAYLFKSLGRATEVERLVRVRTVELEEANRELSERIIERKRAEDALRESEDRYRDLVEQSEDLICTHDLEGTILGANQALVRSLGYERAEEFTGRKLSDFLAPDVRDRFPDYLRTIVNDGHAQGLMKVRTKSGEERLLEYRNSLRTEGLVQPIVRGRSQDVTERVRAEKELARRTGQMQALRDIAVEITKELDLKTILALVVKRAVELTESQFGGIYLWDEASQVLSPEAWSGFGEWMSEARLKLGEGVAGIVAQRREGMIVNDYRTSPYASPLFLERTTLTAVMAEPLLEHERLIGVLAVGKAWRLFHEQDREILGLFSAQAAIAIETAQLYSALEESKSKLEELHRMGSALQEPITLQERLDIVLEVARSVLGFDRINILLPDPDKKMLRAVASVGVEEPLERIHVPLGPEGGGIAKAFAESKEIVWNGDGPVPEEWRLAPPYSEIQAFRSKAFVNVPLIVRGTAIGVLGADNKLSKKAISPETVRLLMTFAAQAALAIDNARLHDEVAGYAKELERKVEERSRALKETQDQLIQSGKLAAVGTLAAGVAHELNQPLMVIRGYAQELLADPRLVEPDLREDLRRIEAQTTRMTAIITNLRDFSRLSIGKRQVTDLSEVVTHAFTFIGPQLRASNIEVTLEVDSALPSVWADPLQIEQVLLNLVTNARDAMEAAGGGTITVRTESTGDGKVSVSVTDTGSGIRPDVQARIFDPFFTTKDVGKGTGLGLSICHGIMEEHGGKIRVESPVADGVGTRFTLILPRSLRDAGGGERE